MTRGKLDNILALREKILTLKTDLDNLQRISMPFAPGKACKNEQKENEMKRTKTPKASVGKTGSDSPVRAFVTDQFKNSNMIKHAVLQ